MAIDALDADAATKHVVLISKPPAASVARLVLDRVAQSPKPFTICFLGARASALPANARAAATLKAAAEIALGTRSAGNAGEAARVRRRSRQAGARPVRRRDAVHRGADRVRAGGAGGGIQRAGAGRIADDRRERRPRHDRSRRRRVHPRTPASDVRAGRARRPARRQRSPIPRSASSCSTSCSAMAAHPDPAGHLAAFLAQARSAAR